MPNISDAVIRSIYEVCGDFRFPVEQYCIGCQNCEHYGFPCANCAAYVFGYRLGFGERGEAVSGGNSDTAVDDEPPPSPTKSEESVTSYPLCDVVSPLDPESPLGLLLQNCSK